MATTSGGVDWAPIIKPIISSIQGKNYEKSDVVDLVQALAKSDGEFQKYDPVHENFYTSLSALAAHIIATNTSFLGVEHVNATRDACKVLVRHLLLKLSEQIATTPEGFPSPNISVKQLLLPLASLCGIEDAVPPRSDITVLTMLLKDAKLPTAPSSVPDTKSTQMTTSPSTERRRTDGLAEVLTGALRFNITSSLIVTNSVSAATTSTSSPGKQSATTVTDSAATKTTEASNGETQEQTSEAQTETASQPTLDAKKLVTDTCVSLLGPMHAGATLLSLCGALPCLQRYLLRLRQAKESGVCQYQHHSADTTLVSFLVKEVGICQTVMSLPCLEPLKSSRITLLTDIGAAWLLCATTQASVYYKDEDGFEAPTAQLVEGALGLFNTIGDILKNSTRAGGYVYQNHQMIGTWVLLSGLHQTLSGAQPATPQPAVKSPARPSRPYNLTRLLQGVQVTWVALGFRCLEGIRSLLADARLEAQASTPMEVDPPYQSYSRDDSQMDTSQPMDIDRDFEGSTTPASLNVLAPHTATQRAARIAACAPLHQLLIFFAVVCFRKATALKRAVVQKQHEQDADHSDSTVYYQDMIMCSEDSETDDEDSEPLLGLWFEATLVAPDGNETNTAESGGADGTETRASNQSGVVPDKAEPYSYISLATEILQVLDKEIVCVGEADAQRLGSSGVLPDTQVNLLVALVRDLDRETARTDTGTISPCFGTRLGQLYSEFSSALVIYLHSLTSSPYMTHLARVLLDPYTTTTPQQAAATSEQSGLVSLQVGCRIVKVMASLILAKPVNDRESCIMSVWSKTVATLVECALQPQPSTDHEYEDMNVEFAQLLVYLFHSLNLMQKKSVLITTANAIIKVCQALKMGDRKAASQVAPHQLMLVTRLLLLLEYIMKHLYDPPPCLLQQIEWNLVIAPGLAPQDPMAPASANAEPPTRMYCSVAHVEQAYRKKISQDADVSMRPKFYALTQTEINNQETPKLDGLACNFVLGTPDKLKYPQLLSALLSLLNCASVYDNRLTVQALCAAHYCFQTAWRLVITMPPSTPHMEEVSKGTGVPLHAIIWSPRAAHQKTFSPWLKDALVKQGLFTQYAENLLSTVTSTCDNIPHTIWLATNTFNQFKENISVDTKLPSLIDVMTVNCVLLRLRFLLEAENAKQQQLQQQQSQASASTATTTTSSGGSNNTTSSSSSSPSPPPMATPQTLVTSSQSMQDFIGQLLDMLETIFQCCRTCVTRDFIPSGEEGATFATSTGGYVVLEGVLRSCGSRAAPWLRGHLPPPAKASLDRAAAGPPFPKPLSTFANDAIPCESGILHIVSKHCQLMSSAPSSAPLLLLALETINTLNCQVQTLTQFPHKDRAVSLLLPACVDGRLEFLQDHAFGILNQVMANGQKVEQAINQEVLYNMYQCMIGDLSTCNDKILKGMVKYWEKVLERPAGRQALEELFGNGKMCLGEVLISAPSARQPYSSRVVRFFNKIFQWCSSSSPVEVCVSVMSKMGSACSTPSPSSAQPGTSPSPWLAGACLASAPTQKDQDMSPAPKNGQDNQPSESCSWSGGASDSKESVALALFSETSNSNDNALLLENLTKHMILHCDESSSMSLLSALISLAPEALRAEHAGLPLPRLLREAARLADAHTGSGHRALLPAALKWFNTCVESLDNSAVLDTLEQGTAESQQKAHLEAACHLLAYISDCLHASFGPPAAPGTEMQGVPPGQLPSWDTPLDVTPEADWVDDPQDEDDTSADDSDEDSMLHLKLCTFTTTAREYMNQHWYHCHTCKMVDSVGVCTVCALVCHRNHDVTYAKYGNFFCDCGAKEDSSCQALVKRSSSHSTSLSRRSGDIQDPQPPPSLLRRRPSSPPHRDHTPPLHRRPAYASNINGIEPWVWDSPEWLSCLSGLQNLLCSLSVPVSRSCERHSAVGRHARARQGLSQLHTGDVKFQITDQLMVPTLGSQEGAFENVRMSYTGEQGQAIRHLIVAHVVRRVAMCCMALPNGKRQHLAVSHEKGKITILQLSQLLKQADTSKRKLTLTRLTSASIPFPVLSLSASPYNEDVLAVTGYRDCHILTFTGGPIYQRLIMQPGLDQGNFIIRSIWLPGNQTQLALVTAEFVKIYDLSKDVSSPEYHFLVPSGKVRDVTFVSMENDTFMLCMASAGHIYWQAMNEVSRATNGPFYITNTVDVVHNDIKDVNGQVGGGGVSIYYSHTLKMLFFSYAQGKSFMAPLTSVEDTLDGVTQIQINQSGSSTTTTSSNSSGSGKSSSNKGAQALCQWQEVPGHPGLVTAVLQASNNPIVMMLTPNSVMLQEIKVIPAKAKITDMVAVRHSVAGDSKTTLILLCEDGSLRIYAASPELTGYWLSPSVSPTHSSQTSPSSATPASVSGKPSTAAGVTVNKRLRNSSLSKSKNSQASGKPGCNPTFPVDFFEHCVALNDVEFGGNDLLQVYNTAQIKHRLATNGLYVVSTKLSGFIMEITNSDSNTVITGIRVLLGNQDVSRTPTYIEVCGRTIHTNVTRNRWYDVPLTREESLQADKKLTVIFGPSNDPEGVCMVDSVKVYGRNKEAFGWPEDNEEGGASASGTKLPQESTNQSSSWTPPGVERLVCGLLETLELSLGAPGSQQRWGSHPKDTATNLLCAPCPPPLQARCKALLHALLGQAYHFHKDQAILNHVMVQLREMYIMDDARNADPENFFRLLLLTRAVATVRPQNLVKYAGVLPPPPNSPSECYKAWTSSTVPTHLAPLLVGVLTKLSSVPSPPCPPCLAPVDRSGLRHHDHALHALADIIHTLMVHATDQTMVDMGNRIYLSLLLSEDQMISFGAKSAIIRVLRPRVKRRRVYIPSPPATPGASSSSHVARSESPLGAVSSTGSTGQSGVTGGDQNHNQARQFMDVDQVVDMSRLLGTDAEGLEALLDIPPDADDEAMVEFAIVLSLQEGRGGAAGGAGAPALPRGGSGAPSDATASATGSDEEEGDGEVEGEADGATGSGGAEVSPVGRSSESGSATSGRSSAYGETTARTNIEGGEASQWTVDMVGGADTAAKVRSLRLALLDLMVEELPNLRGLPGIRTIPFMQVLLMLASAMECGVESEQVALERCLCFLVSELSGNGATSSPTTNDMTLATVESQPSVHCRTPRRDLQLLIMRLLSVLMARWKPTSGSTPAPSTSRLPSEWYTARTAASWLRSAGVISRCEEILRELLPYWKEQQNIAAAAVGPTPSGTTVARGAAVTSTASSGAASTESAQNEASSGQTGQMQLLRPQPPHPLPDMQPFFLRQYVKTHAWDVLENYPNLLTEMSLRLPYQVQQHCEPPAPPFSTTWHSLLCQYMMNQQTPFLRKQVRKLLLMMCGTKEKYRQLRDIHALSVHLEGVHKIVEEMDFSYDSMVTLMDHLKACVEIVVARTGNWQHMCSVHSPNTLSYLIGAACLLGRGEGEGVAPTILMLLQGALCNTTTSAAANNTSTVTATNATSSDRTERGRSAESDASVTVSSKFQEQMVPQLVQQILNQVSMEQLRHFIRVFLLETNSTSVRWQAHALLLAIYENCSSNDQMCLVKLMWELWPVLPQFGRKTAQFVDLLGYFSLKTPQVPMEDCLKSAVNLLKSQNQVLTQHGNAPIYSALSNYVELEGYYLESEPCLVCNNPEMPMSTIKLSNIRIDSKFTTQTQIVKLAGSHTISRIGLRIGDLKRTKMVRTINVFYNNRTVQAVQELKNKPGMWHKAKTVLLVTGQTDARIDFPLPIVACNLMMEYADFYENTQASGESLQCPRCSAAVPANPGVCANCGENVFQCHKCRAINYDEKDPFLCHACGFCKYAKFDYTLTARPCCAVEHIENDEDRKRMVASIGLLLDKADKVYRQLVANKPLIENLLHKISEHRVDVGRGPGEEGAVTGGGTGSTGTSATSSGAQVNKVIQYVAHKYCVDSKNHFDDLSKIIQRVLTCRRELVVYDKSQSDQLKSEAKPSYTTLLQQETNKALDTTEAGHCYGCALAAASHCLTLLRALASSPEHRQKLCQLGLVTELVHHNLRRGSPQSQEEVRQLICVVTRDNLPATRELCNLLSQRITLGLLGHAAAQDHTNAVRPLVLLLGGLVKIQDSSDCWEVRLRCVIGLWVWCCPYLSNSLGVDTGSFMLPPPPAPGQSPQDAHALQQVALPCLQYLHHLMQPPTNKDGTKENLDELPEAPPLDLGAWLAGRVSYADWKRRRATPTPTRDTELDALSARDEKLALKCTNRWKAKAFRTGGPLVLSLGDGGWLKPVMFNPSSKMARDVACQMIKSLCTSYERTKVVLLLLNQFLPEICSSGEASEQFLQLYQSLASDAPWKQFLALHGVLSKLANLLTIEIDHLHVLEETTLTSDLAQGYALKRLTELMAMFLEEPGVRRAYKGRLMGAVLGGYLSLRRLVVQRTRLIDDTQEKLLELLEEMTTGTEAETAEFMAVCIETVKKYPLHDFRTPVFIFERLCSIIYPEENDVGVFLLSLEKDPQQEDFLQGRMLGNPYSSLEPGLGPLMRDVKNKICTDCELVALLEDDNGMELLVNNKIMSLDLPVKEVYKKVWCVSGESDAMRVVYRMRGLLGDATEEFVETLSSSTSEAVDDEQVYKMANVLAYCGGIEVMLERLAVAGGGGGAARPLARTLLRLLSLCVRARSCVRVLTQHTTQALPALLQALNMTLNDERNLPRPELTCNLLEIMDRILSVAAGESMESFLQFSLTFGGPEYVQTLLNCTQCPGIRSNPEALQHLTRVLAALVYGNELKMAHLCQHFKQVLDFNKFDAEHRAEDEFRLELFCVLCSGIERNAIGGTLKDYLISLGIVRDALDYITMHAPCVKPTLLRTDSDELKEFISKPALKYILRFLTGLATDHEPTQMAVCEKVIPIVHRLEQVSSDEHVGSLAENLLEALMSEPQAAKTVRDARDYTRQEKKRLAMAMREKQLGALGMRTNDKGQVTAQCSLTHQVQELGEETGAICCICREGYKYQPTKVLGIYTFTKRCAVEEFEVKARKTLGYTTVTHYNVVHVECHMAAVRLARSRDEWESAALQNASTKCNGLLPLWGPHVPESAYASCLARHNTYLQDCTGHHDIGYQCTVHDLKLLLLRFAREKPFHEDTGGGGPLSNMQLVPSLIHMALYVINTTRIGPRLVANLQVYLEWSWERQLESSHEAEGPLYYLLMPLLLQPPTKWRESRLEHLRRILILSQVRSVSPSALINSLQGDQTEPRPYEEYKPYLMYYSLVQLLYDEMFKHLPTTAADQWSVKLAEAIRHGDEGVLRCSERILSTLSEQLLPCQSIEEWLDAIGLLGDVPDPNTFLRDTLQHNT